MIFGYGRCSTDETKQDLTRQERELKAVGAEETYLEYVHGTDKTKPELEKLLNKAVAGDTIIVCEASRLSRSTLQLCELINIIKEKQMCLVIIGSITIDCRNGEPDPMSNAFLQMSAVFAELERQMIRARVNSGLSARKAYCAEHNIEKWTGRPKSTVESIPDVFMRYYPMYEAGTVNRSELSRLTELSRPTVNKYIRLIEG